MADVINITIVGIEKVTANLKKFSQQINPYMSAAGQEAMSEVLDTEGLRKYPPATEANQPPEPYYIRGRGTQYKRGNKGNSERYGTQFYTKTSAYGIKAGNRASYAPYLMDDEKQAEHMARIGWRKLIDVAQEKKKRIVEIMQGWVDKLIKELGL
jgi:hypothetical protein